jgi:hypothetical protein
VVIETSIFWITPRETIVTRQEFVVQSALDNAIACLHQRLWHGIPPLKSKRWRSITWKALPGIIRFVLKCNGTGDLFRSVGKEIWVVVQRTLNFVAEKFGMDMQASVVFS